MPNCYAKHHRMPLHIRYLGMTSMLVVHVLETAPAHDFSRPDEQSGVLGVGEGPRQCESPVQAGSGLHADTRLHRGSAGPGHGPQGRTHQPVSALT